MSTPNNGRRGAPWALMLLSMAGIVLLVIGLFVGIDIHHAGKPGALAATAAVASAPASGASAADAPRVGAAVSDDASVWVGNGVVKFYFVVGRAELAVGAKEALAGVVMGVAAGKRVAVSGYRAMTGNTPDNEELARQRAMAVHDVLASLGIGQDKIDLRSPGTTVAGSAETRCIEVRLE